MNSPNPHQNPQERKPRTKRKCHLPEATQQLPKLRAGHQTPEPILMALLVCLSHCGGDCWGLRANPFPCSGFPAVCTWDVHGQLHWCGFGQPAPSGWLRLLDTSLEDLKSIQNSSHGAGNARSFSKCLPSLQTETKLKGPICPIVQIWELTPRQR